MKKIIAISEHSILWRFLTKPTDTEPVAKYRYDMPIESVFLLPKKGAVYTLNNKSYKVTSIREGFLPVSKNKTVRASLITAVLVRGDEVKFGEYFV